MLLYTTIMSLMVLSKAMQSEEENVNPISTDVIIEGKRFEHEHNNWDHLRTRCGLTHLQCLICDEQLQLRVGDVSRLSHRLCIKGRKLRNKVRGVKSRRKNGLESAFSQTDKQEDVKEAQSNDHSEKSHRQRKCNELLLEFRDFREVAERRITQLEQRVKQLEQGFTTGSF